MTWDTAKLVRGKAYVQEIEIALDACRFTQGNFWLYKNCINSVSRNSSYTGTTTVISDSNLVSTWSPISNVYAKNLTSGEIMRVSISVVNSITIISRGLFGTTAATIGVGHKLEIMHLGEADGSCRGYPYSCTSGDSYSATAKLSPVFSNSPSRAGIYRLSGLRNIRYDDGEVDVGETIGSRASLSFDISDQRHGDNFFVPYPERRTETGTLFGKLLARHPYLEGRKVTYREGYRDPYSLDEPEWIERTLIIDSYKLSDEKLSVHCLDPLTLTEDKKAKMPLASPARLLAALSTGGAGTTFSFYDAPDYYFGAMSASILVRIDSEVIICTVSGAKQLTVVTRGYRSTTKTHDLGASIQDCIRFTSTHVVDAIVYALENFTEIPASYIDTAAYATVKALMATAILDDAVITKPTPVVDFINDMIKIGNLGLHFDTVTSKIVMIYVPVQEVEAISLDEQDHIKRSSLSIDDNTKSQYTRCSAMWGLTDITSDQEEKYAVVYTSINYALESGGGLGQISERKLQKFPLLTNSVDDSLLGASYATRITNENDSKPKIVMFDLDSSQLGATQAGELKKGSVINLSTKYNQDKDGNNLSELFQVRKISGDGYSGYKIKAKKFQFLVADNIDFTISENKVHYDLSSDFSPAAGNYIVYIAEGVEIISTDRLTPAFTTGSQAVGVTFTIINAGKILSVGGDGGDFGWTSSPPVAGEDGGLCFNATVDCEIQTAAGLIWAGGGGGGGSMSELIPGGPPDYIDYYLAASGGSGGQGSGTSLGGYYTNGGLTGGVPDGIELSGNTSSAGASGNIGGAFGQNGSLGGGSGGAAGGLSGIAIKSNGKSVTITSGNNDLNIKGFIL